MPSFSQPMVQGAGNISTTEQFFSLLPSPQTVMSWPASLVLPEARHMVGWGGNLQQPGLFNGNSSTFLTPPTLSPIPQSSFGWSVNLSLNLSNWMEVWLTASIVFSLARSTTSAQLECLHCSWPKYVTFFYISLLVVLLVFPMLCLQ